MASEEPNTSRPDSKKGQAPSVDPDAKAESDVKNKDGEVGGPKGPEPTRFGDWEQKGRCTDF